jgi:DNA mismatch repair protein MutS
VTTGATTPLMQQYGEIKARHPDSILFFRMGDFYEMFYEDAETASRVLGLTLTSRNNGGAAAVPLAGIPVRAATEYLRRFVEQGFRVSICEQIEDPKFAKGVVKRAVTETITPGAVFSDDLLDRSRDNFVAALTIHEGRVGIAAADVSTGGFRLAVTDLADLDAVLARLAPREVLMHELLDDLVQRQVRARAPLCHARTAWEFDPALGRDALLQQFQLTSLAGLGLEASAAPAIGAAGALLRYLKELQPAGLPQLARPVLESVDALMPLDDMTRRNLELVENLRGGSDGTVLRVLDRTHTPMGARRLRQWLLAPLTDLAAIDARLDAVGALADDGLARGALRTALDGVRDIERLASKAAAGRASPRDLRALGDSLMRLPAVSAAVAPTGAPGALGALLDQWDDAADLAHAITHTLVDRPPVAFGDGETIAPGVDAELDALRRLRDGGKDAIAALQMEERARTGIATLKVGYNRVFGYFLEVTRANAHLVPADYQRRQTLTGAERYVTPALQAFEERILTASERSETLERERFEALRATIGAAIARLQLVADRVATLDVFAALAEVAAHEGYVRPRVTADTQLHIVGGRHPVVEQTMPRDQFIPNDVHLDEAQRVIILTGPNMAGKSTILRQIGLIVLLAQVGAYVPASEATIGICDRVFTRVGASDDLGRGQSTFMVEMAETSAILHTATARSLVLLDEIGRGTATWDGLSIAWAVTEHLHERVGCKTVFATHYHELTQLADDLPAVRNFNVAVREIGERIVFLHRIQPGGADRSYGIEVGRLAGLPPAVIARARTLLRSLEGEAGTRGTRRHAAVAPVDQLGLFGAPLPHPIVTRLASVDSNDLTPLQALQLVAELAEQARHGALT